MSFTYSDEFSSRYSTNPNRIFYLYSSIIWKILFFVKKRVLSIGRVTTPGISRRKKSSIYPITGKSTLQQINSKRVSLTILNYFFFLLFYPLLFISYFNLTSTSFRKIEARNSKVRCELINFRLGRTKTRKERSHPSVWFLIHLQGKAKRNENDGKEEKWKGNAVTVSEVDEIRWIWRGQRQIQDRKMRGREHGKR